MHGGGARHRRTRFRDRLHHQGGLQNAEPSAAIGFRHGDAEPARLGHRAMEVVRERGRAVVLQPIGVVEPGAEAGHLVAYLLLVGAECEIHSDRPPWHCAYCPAVAARAPEGQAAPKSIFALPLRCRADRVAELFRHGFNRMPDPDKLPAPPSSADMQALVGRAGLALNPGQMADSGAGLETGGGPAGGHSARTPLGGRPGLCLPAATAHAVRPRRSDQGDRSGAAETPPGQAATRRETATCSRAAAQATSQEPMRGDALPFLTIAEAGRLIAAKKLSPVELTRSLLERIGAVDPTLNTYVTVTDRAALAAARAAERAVRSGRKAPLLGIPVAYKDIYETAGVRTTAHSRLLAENVPNRDAEAVRRLALAGAVMLGKLATHEFAIGGPAFDLPWPPARNPWDPRRYTGGSSSGSGAAVAAGLALGALGSDTGGSIRLPAAYCGIAGFKPTPGLVSRRGVIPLAPSLDTAGPMAWTAQDCALLLDAIAGHDPADPASVAAPAVSYARAIAAPVKGLRIGLLRRFYERDVPASTEMLKMINEAVRVLEDLGCEVRDATLPPVQAFNAVGRVIITAEAYALHESNLRTNLDEFSRAFRIRVLAGALISAADYIAAQRKRTDLIAEMATLFERFDVLLSLPTVDAAPLLAEQRPDEGFVRPFPTTVANVAAVPSLVVCGGFNAAGLPLGLEFVGPAWGDATVLRVGHHFEEAAGNRGRRPG